MASFVSTSAVLKVDGNAVAELSDVTINESADTLEASVIGDTAKQFKAGMTEWGGSATAFWDDTDVNGQGVMTAGAQLTLAFRPEGETAGDFEYTGTIYITGVDVAVPSASSIITRSFTFKGTGALTKTTV